jgi:hypothetical protein
MFKKVNIYPQGPIFSLVPPITGPALGVKMCVGDIQLCLNARALVDEVLSNGDKIRLNLSNYNKDNSIVVIKEEPVVNIQIQDKLPDNVSKTQNDENTNLDSRTSLEEEKKSELENPEKTQIEEKIPTDEQTVVAANTSNEEEHVDAVVTVEGENPTEIINAENEEQAAKPVEETTAVAKPEYHKKHDDQKEKIKRTKNS